jgi:16S rRNA (cytosine967-C5)-methyltransferase
MPPAFRGPFYWVDMTMKPQQLPLWLLMLATAEGVKAVRLGRSATDFLASLDGSEKPAVHALLMGVLRVYGLAMAVRKQLVRTVREPLLGDFLDTALAIAMGEREQQAPGERLYDAHTLVNQAVEAAKRHKRLRAYAPLVNGVLRTFERERSALLPPLLADPALRYGYPAWWVKQLQTDHPAHWREILDAGNSRPPLTLRVQQSRVSADEFSDALNLNEIGFQRIKYGTFVLSKNIDVQRIPGYEEGWFSVQDAAAQEAGPLLINAMQCNERVTQNPYPRLLDACAAPGGKTIHLLDLVPNARVTALDIDGVRAQRIADNLTRFSLQADVKVADAAVPAQWWMGERFDGILLDAPCSASGIVRRHADIRWLRRPDDTKKLSQLQNQLLDTVWPLLQPGGVLLYCTCSVFRAEGSEVASAFLARHTDATSLPSPGHLLPAKAPVNGDVGDNPSHQHDGFFYALFQKQK